MAKYFSMRDIAYCGSSQLAEVRHGSGRNWSKCFRINSGDGRVYTTLAVEFEMLGETDTELQEERSLLGRGFGDAAQPDLVAIGGGKDDIGTLQRGKQSERPHRREWLGGLDAAHRRRNNCGLALQQIFQRDPERVAQKGHHHVSLDTRLPLMKQRPNRQLAF